MTPRALAALLALALVAAPALAQETPATAPLEGVRSVSVGNATLGHWVGTSTAVDQDVAQGEEASIWFALSVNATARTVVYLNVTSTSDTLLLENGTLVLDTLPEARTTANLSIVPTVADAGVVDMSYAFTGEVWEERDGTLELVGPVSGDNAFTYDVGSFVAPPPSPGVPREWLFIGLAVLLLAGGGLGLVARQRAVKRRMNAAPRRSQVMREMELEQKLEKAKAKDPEAAVVIQQEIRQAEQVREKRRELQILEAKRADALKTLDLLKKRHEAGGLTKLQYDNMVAKKRQDLERIEAEIAEMERQDSGAAA
ncbi:MAG TPA: hypothetical protein VFH78_13230 [Candidatus Thermoplasmatota archaeon]|nr:hypothetical protein [Candidatus Thermoplasmatota archaeon]